MPLLKTCRLAFDHRADKMKQVENGQLEYQISLPNLLNTNHLRELTIGIHTSSFLERLLLCVPCIENLSFGVEDRDDKQHSVHEKILSV